jgi:hypothetical protein
MTFSVFIGVQILADELFLLVSLHTPTAIAEARNASKIPTAIPKHNPRVTIPKMNVLVLITYHIYIICYTLYI